MIPTVTLTVDNGKLEGEEYVFDSPQVCAIAWKAQKRLHGRLHRLIGRGKNKAEAVTAVARELAGFVWAISREENLLVS